MGPPSSKLRRITVPIIDRQQCRRLYSPSSITNNMICAGDLKGGKDSCGVSFYCIITHSYAYQLGFI